MKQSIKDNITVWSFSLTHGFIDLASSLVVYNSAIAHGLSQSKAFTLIIMYDMIAFAFQPIAGFIIDYVKGARSAMLTGIVLTLVGVVLMPANAIAAVIVVGLGNALFHLGAGAQILSRYPHNASSAGIFVGPGAVGLSLGVYLGNQGFFPFIFLITILTTAFAGLAFLPSLKKKTFPQESGFNLAKSRLDIVILLLAAIAVRGFAGRSGFTGLQSGAFSAIGLGIAACVGKIAGGVVADRFGWGWTAVFALTFATIGIAFVHSHISVAFASMILFQMTMPITLTATSAAIPGKPAFAFGLTCLALITGTLPTFFIPANFIQLPFTLTLIVFSAASIIIALWRMGHFKTGTLFAVPSLNKT